MARVLGFIHRWEWTSGYVDPPNGKRVAVEVFAPIEEEGCRMPPPEIEKECYLKRLGYTYTVTAVRRQNKCVVRKRDLPRQAEPVFSPQMMFEFAKGRI